MNGLAAGPVLRDPSGGWWARCTRPLFAVDIGRELCPQRFDNHSATVDKPLSVAGGFGPVQDTK
jgi:hypothetical protein